jgi:putative transposase
VTQRGDGQAQTFFEAGDYALSRFARGILQGRPGLNLGLGADAGTVHLILTPTCRPGLPARAGAPSPLCRPIHARRRRPFLARTLRRGGDGQDHLAAALRYVALNPCRRASSARRIGAGRAVHAHLAARELG